MKKHERFWSYLLLLAVYILAAAAGGLAGYGVFVALGGSGLPEIIALWLAALAGDIAATLLVFVFSLIFRNASVYDPYWSLIPIEMVWAYLFLPNAAATPAAILDLIAVTVWGVRLTANWAYTFRGISHQDWRYTQLKEQTGKFYFFVNLIGIHMVPTLVVFFCMLPVLYTFFLAPAFNAGAAVFFALSLLAVGLQGTADVQMHIFRKTRPTTFIRTGLWKYSRHPNYLGEILMWWGIALSAVCVMPENWWLIAGAAANTCLFLFVSIPLADGRQAKKEGFAEYKKNTRMLLPLYKRQK